MSKKTLITFFFIIIIAMFFCNNLVIQANCYGIEEVNATEDENLENTKELYIDNNVNKNLYFDENKENNYNETEYNQTSRSETIERNIETKTEELSTQNAKVVENVYEKVFVKEEYKQGVKVVTYNNITYNVYGDGEKYIINSVESIEIDNSTYNGNTGTLLFEANNNILKYNDKINEVLELTNQYRNEVGLNNLVLDENLCVAATVRALEMSYVENLSHTRPDGAKCFRVLDDLAIHYNYAGENIGDGYKYAENVSKAWKESPSHYENIISNKYNKIGIGVAQSLNGRYYWVQIFSN